MVFQSPTRSQARICVALRRATFVVMLLLDCWHLLTLINSFLSFIFFMHLQRKLMTAIFYRLKQSLWQCAHTRTLRGTLDTMSEIWHTATLQIRPVWPHGHFGLLFSGLQQRPFLSDASHLGRNEYSRAHEAISSRQKDFSFAS